MKIMTRYRNNNLFLMSLISFFSACTLLLLLLFQESECNKVHANDFRHVVEAARESNKKKRKLTKFDNTIIGEIKKELELSIENEDTFYKRPENIKEYNTKNNTFVKLWLSDIDLRYSGSLVFGGDISTVKSQKTSEEGQEEFEINKIIEENRLLDKLNLLRQQDVEVTGLGEVSQFDELTRKKILASGILIVPHKSDDHLKSETQKEVTNKIATVPVELEEEDDDTITLITPKQQITALEILTGNKLIHTIQLNMEVDETVTESNNLIESNASPEYEEKDFLECVEIKKNLIQKIGKLKLENANLSLHAQKLKNKERKTKEYGNVLENIEKNKESLHNHNIELLKIERRIQQLSAEDRMEDRNPLEEKNEVLQEKEAALRKKERRKVIINAILEEAKRRKLIEQKNKESKRLIEENEHNEKNDIEKKSAESEEATKPKGKHQDLGTEEIRKIAKMLVWLQENDSKTLASIDTRKERGASAIKSLNKLYISDKQNFHKVAEKIKNNFEEKVYEKNQQKNANKENSPKK
ncbi:uncharacterized protein cubi_03589 [Cryptosporidium ubiquitum]|uniref:Uncharacterized protein n=1 Tax=Cryptosporidium ubiquitum TaxID=857276 RepID=A0A1J4MIE2_9CRYT|nr:uncharacterized protein cubi_03589 [Cryptosporidium ubiquitum]OII73791.1 hypothetical protein cubi_03589 [Cryptosporidium ubiquitum]